MEQQTTTSGLQALQQVAKPSLTEQLMQRAGINPSTKDNSWDYIATLAERVRNSLMTTTMQVDQGRGFLESYGRLTPEAQILIKGIQDSVQNAAMAWRDTSLKHQGRTGFGANAQEHSTITSIGLEYIQIFEVMAQQNMFTLPRLQEMIIECEQAIKASKEAEATNFEPTGV